MASSRHRSTALRSDCRERGPVGLPFESEKLESSGDGILTEAGQVSHDIASAPGGTHGT